MPRTKTTIATVAKPTKSKSKTEITRDNFVPNIYDGETWNELFNEPRAASGVAITRHTSFGIPAWYSGIDLISSAVAKVAVAGSVIKFNNDGSTETDYGHPAYPLLTRRFHQLKTAFDGWAEILTNSLWSGNGYAYIYRSPTGVPLEIYPLQSELTWPIVYRDAIDLRLVNIQYQTTWGGVMHIIDAADMIHLKSGISNYDGFVGMSLIETLKDILGLAIAEQKYASHYFQHEGMSTLIIEIPSYIPKEQADELKARIIEQRTGVKNAFKPLILNNNAKAHRLTLSNDESQLLGSREFSNLDIALILGLPPSKLGCKQNTSYNSLEQDNAAMVSQCFDKHFTRLEQELDNKLLTEFEKDRDTRRIRFNRERLLATDTPAYSAMLVSQYTNGIRTKNRVRQLLGEDSIGPEGDVFLTPTTLAESGKEEPHERPAVEPAPTPDPKDENPANVEVLLPSMDRFKALTGTTITRLLTRLKKSVKCADDLAGHKEVFLEALSAFGPDAERLFSDIEVEVKEILPEQIGSVFDRLDAMKLAGDLCK